MSNWGGPPAVPPGAAPAGWYPDPVTGTLRWFDGTYWGDFASQHGYDPTPAPYAAPPAWGASAAPQAWAPSAAPQAWAPSAAPPAWGGPRSAPQAWGTPSAGSTLNGLAVASFVLSLVWLGWLGSLLGVVFGHVALSQLKRGGSGRGFAIAGLVLGYMGLAFLALVIVLGAVSASGSGGTTVQALRP